MSRAGPRSLAIGWDAAAPELVAELRDAGDLPGLSSVLADDGRWSSVCADRGAGPIPPWPSFITGGTAAAHEMVALWRWDPGEMKLVEHALASDAPFWRGGKDTWGVFDVPLASASTPLRRPGGFEISGWWTAQTTPGRRAASTQRLPRRVSSRHPIAGHEPRHRLSPDDAEILARRCRAAVVARGGVLRALLAESAPHRVLAVFYELHWASHRLWHCLHPDAPARVRAALHDIFREADRQLMQLVASHPSAGVCVFGIYGMGAQAGIPSLTAPLLVHHGHSTPETGGPARGLTPGMPRRTRRVLRALASDGLRHAAARGRSTPRWDWARTTAFALPTEHHGLVRINLAGRERLGIVAPARYAEVCDAVARSLTDARDRQGQPLVRSVHRMSQRLGHPPATAPDLVVEWTDAAHADPVHVAGTLIAAAPGAPWLTGQHRYEGFCVTGRGHPHPSAQLAPEHFAALLGGAAA